ncbi:MAG: 4Fe-4S dicluster domain-containing protein [Bacteriovoracaceae bacterium]
MSRFKPRELHAERLSTTDEKGNRVYLFPEDVRGFYRRIRTTLFSFLVILYLVLPWTYFKGEQTLLLDIANRRFVLFGHVFWGHDAPLLIFLFLGICFFIALITAIWGRVWCGHACPQTVFLDLIYRRIEILVEGKVRDRILLEEGSMNMNKLFKRTVKWILYFLVSAIIAHSFIGYFVGTKNLWSIVTHNPEQNWTIFTMTFLLTAIFAFDFGWFREQFCIIACPYGRFQSVLMDQDSYHVTYDNTRNDCINCFRCVAVCPTGIDIRRGTQMECIGCTQCIDACDEIMLKVQKPIRLIRYETENGLKKLKTKIIRPRTIIYSVALCAVMIGFFLTVKSKENMFTLWIRNTTPYTVNTQGSEKIITNQFKLELFHHEVTNVYFKVNNKEVHLVTPTTPFQLKDKRKETAIIFFQFPQNILKNGSHRIKVDLYSDKDLLKEDEVELVGPIN